MESGLLLTSYTGEKGLEIMLPPEAAVGFGKNSSRMEFSR